jgi:hypothetical protein
MALSDSGIVRRLRYFWLLVALLMLFLLAPFMGDTEVPRFIAGILFTVLVAAAAVSASDGRRRRVTAVLLAIPAVVLGWSALYLAGTWIVVLSDLAYVLLLGFALGCLLNVLIRVAISDFNIICGAVACYLLIATTWAFSYRIIETVAPGSFSLSGQGSDGILIVEYLYFSLTTMTTLGYGDVLPTSPFARIWSNLEAVTGTLYIALLIARLVAVYRPR